MIYELLKHSSESLTKSILEIIISSIKPNGQVKTGVINFPELKIIKFKDKILKPGKGIDKKKDINIFLAPIKGVEIVDDEIHIKYKQELLNKNDWVSVTYHFKNVGNEDILCLYVINNLQKTSVLCDVDSLEYCIDHELFSCSECYDQIVRKEETFSLKVYYHKESVMSGTFSAGVTIAMEDRNRRYWTQSLFTPENKIYEVHPIKYKDYINEIRIDKAIECFKKPWLW